MIIRVIFGATPLRDANLSFISNVPCAIGYPEVQIVIVDNMRKVRFAIAVKITGYQFLIRRRYPCRSDYPPDTCPYSYVPSLLNSGSADMFDRRNARYPSGRRR